MSRSVIVGAVVLVLAAITGVIWTQSDLAPQQEATQPVPEVQEGASDAAIDDLQATAQEAADAAQDAVDTATEAATEAATGAAEAASDAANDAVESVTGAAAAASDAARGVVDEVTETTTDAVTGAVETAQEAASDAAASLSDSVGGDRALDGALSVEGFDADAVLDAVESSDLGGVQKTGLSALVEQARTNPDLIEGVIAQVKEALGL